MEDSEYSLVMKIDLEGTWRFSKAIITYWRAREPRVIRDDSSRGTVWQKVEQRGSLVNVASSLGSEGKAYLAVYCELSPHHSRPPPDADRFSVKRRQSMELWGFPNASLWKTLRLGFGSTASPLVRLSPLLTSLRRRVDKFCLGVSNQDFASPRYFKSPATTSRRPRGNTWMTSQCDALPILMRLPVAFTSQPPMEPPS
jgi:hypothetical protein